MNRIDAKFIELKNNKKKAFMPYICAGDPTLDLSRELLLTLEKAGADLIEFGIPFLIQSLMDQLYRKRAKDHFVVELQLIKS